MLQDKIGGEMVFGLVLLAVGGVAGH